jgi:hypothetical protein
VLGEPPWSGLSLRSVNTFRPVGQARGIESIGFFELKRGSKRPKRWAHDLAFFARLNRLRTL